MPDIRKLSSRKLQAADNLFLQLRKSLPKQNPKAGGAEAAAVEAISSGATASKYILLVNFVINLTLSASLNQLWAMIETQQLIVMLPLCAISLPLNAAAFFKMIF